MGRRRPLGIALAIAVMVGVTTATLVTGRGTSRDLENYLLYLGEDAGRPWDDGRAGVAPDLDRPHDDGVWSVTPGSIEGGRLPLHVEVEPPVWTLPVEPGPAVLVVSLTLGGGFEGDMYRRHPVSVVPVPLAPCGDPCRFVADVSVDMHRLPALARRIDDFQGTTTEVNLALVRSFAGGTWLQVVDASGEGESGRLGAPTPWTGTAPAVGLFPAVAAGGRGSEPGPEPFDYGAAVRAARDEFPDPTTPAQSRGVRFRATVAGCDDVGLVPSIRTRDGDRVSFDTSGTGDMDGTVLLPVGTTWRVEGDEAATPIVIDGNDLSVRADHACVENDAGDLVQQVSVHVEPTAVAPPPGSPSAAAAVTRRDVHYVLVPAWDAVAIDGTPIVIPDDAIAREQDRHLTMSFARHGNDTWATGGGACNGWGAVVDVSFDGSFALDDDGPWSTAMGCGEPREAIDRAFAGALRRAASWDIGIDGTLRLIDADQAEVLAFTEAPAPTLPGDYYLMAATDEDEAEVDLGPADMPIRVSISDDAISTSVGCNAIGGGYRQNGHRIDMNAGPLTLAWCDGLMDLETDLRSALLSATAVHAGDHGGLTLLDTLGFERVHLARVDDPDIFGYTERGGDALVGTSWTVRRLRDPALLDEELRPVRREMEGDDVVVTFGADSRITGSTGCGELTGDYRTDRSWIAIHASPERPCDDADRAWTESILLDALDKAGSITLDERLVLRDRPGGTILLSAEPRP